MVPRSTSSPRAARALLALGVLTLAACADDPPGAPDAAAPADGGLLDAAADGGVPDAAVPVDAGARPDAGPRPDGGSLAGTPLEGLTVRWDKPLHLCAAWREGRTADQEAASKAELVLEPNTRALEAPALEQAAPLVGWIRVNAPRRTLHSLDPDPARAALVEWTLAPIGVATHLTATLEHTLPDGVIVETISAMREPGRTDPIAAASYEHSLAWRPRGGADADVAIFVPCGGDPSLEDAIDVLTLETTSATRTITIVRSLRTALALAGSAPVHVEAVEVHDADLVGEPGSVRGYWPFVYAAEHHNWNVDFTITPAEDPGSFGPFGARGVHGAVESLRVQHLDAFDVTPTATLVERDMDGKRTVTRLIPRTRSFDRVDRTELERGFASTCAGASVVAVSSYDRRNVLQLQTCPSRGPLGFDVRGVVPVVFQLEPRATFDERQTIEATPTGVRFRLGTHTVALDATGFGAVEFIVRRGDEERLRVYASPLPLSLDVRPDEVVEGASADGRAAYTLVRRPVAQGVGNSTIFAPVSLAIRIGDAATGRTVRGWDPRLHRYANSHHNWADSLETENDDYHLRWRAEIDQTGVDFLLYTIEATPKRPGLPALPPTRAQPPPPRP